MEKIKHLVFSTEQEAIDADERVSTLAGFPRFGRNAKTGELALDKQATENWAMPFRRRTDHKWCVVEPAEIFATLGNQDVNSFNNDFSFSIEERTDNW